MLRRRKGGGGVLDAITLVLCDQRFGNVCCLCEFLYGVH
jgi:hypothetical protein